MVSRNGHAGFFTGNNTALEGGWINVSASTDQAKLPPGSSLLKVLPKTRNLGAEVFL